MWKEAIVIPLIKKVGQELIENNYKPVSNHFLREPCFSTDKTLCGLYFNSIISIDLQLTMEYLARHDQV